MRENQSNTVNESKIVEPLSSHFSNGIIKPKKLTENRWDNTFYVYIYKLSTIHQIGYTHTHTQKARIQWANERTGQMKTEKSSGKKERNDVNDEKEVSKK